MLAADEPHGAFPGAWVPAGRKSPGQCAPGLFAVVARLPARACILDPWLLPHRHTPRRQRQVDVLGVEQLESTSTPAMARTTRAAPQPIPICTRQ